MTCLHCARPIPLGSRRDRLYCTKSCGVLASRARRKNGQPPPARWQHPALNSTDSALRAAACCAQQLGQVHGWHRCTIRLVIDGLVAVLDGRPVGQPVTLTEVRTRTPRHASTPRIAEVLTEMGLLDIDTAPAVRSWIDRRVAELPAGFAGTIRSWLRSCSTGTPAAVPARTAASTSISAQ